MKKPAASKKTGKSKALEANTGAGPAIAARSKDAKAPAKSASQKTSATKSEQPKAAAKTSAKPTTAKPAVKAAASKPAASAKATKASPKAKAKTTGIAAAPAAIAKGASATDYRDRSDRF